MQKRVELTQLEKQQIEIDRLSNWLDLVERDVKVHFNSWSWKVGWWIIRALKMLLLQEHRSSNQYRIQQVLKAYRIWRSQKATTKKRSHMLTRKKYDFTFLIGEQGIKCIEKEWITNGSIQIVGFENNPDTIDTEIQPENAQFFPKEKIPGFFECMTSALLCISGKMVIIYDSSLTGLGLGLLHNYHFGTPLVFRGCSIKQNGKKEEWNDKLLKDPFHQEWNKFLGFYTESIPTHITDAKTGVMSGSIEFAEKFADFHKRAMK